MTDINERIAALSPAKQEMLRQRLLKQKPALQKRVIARRPSQGPGPLSFAQERLWFLDQLEPNTATYNVPMALGLEGAQDAGVLERSLGEILRRHEPLRTRFEAVEGQPVQVIQAAAPFEMPLVDLTALPEPEREAEAMRLCQEEARRPFDLGRDLMLRARLLRLGEGKHVVVLNVHHIASDGWSLELLVDELGKLYEAFAAGKPSPLPELAIEYGDFAAWQREWLQGEALEKQLAYWRKQLEGAPALLELPTDRPRPAAQSYRGALASWELPKPLAVSLAELGRREGTTLFMTLLTAYQALLHRYTGGSQILVGSPAAGRNWTEVEPLIGFFINTLVFRADLSDDPSFRTLLHRTRETALGAFAHQDLPFEKLVKELLPERDMSHSPFFQVMFVLQSAARETLDLGGLRATPIPLHSGTSKVDLALYVRERGEGLQTVAEYNTDLFDADTVRRMLAHYQTLLEGIVVNPDRRLSDLPLLTGAERRQLLVEWNPDYVGPDLEGCVHQLFEKQAARSPDSVAVVIEEETLTYRQLNERSNQLAGALKKMGVGPETLVGVYMERSLEMVVGILGILKAGGAYLPLDPVYPPERLAFMLEDARPKAVLTQQRLRDSLPANGAPILLLDGELERFSSESRANPEAAARLDDLAYVIYTSGSTGKPKGTLVTHRNVARLFQATEAWYGFGPRDVWTLFHSHAFDFSVWEIWGALAYGGRLVVVPYWVSRSPDAFCELLRKEKVTVLNQTPSAFRQLIQADAAADPTQPLALRYVIFGGEALEMQSLKPWFERHGDACPKLVNMYGITETTVHVTYRPLSSADLKSGSVIGIPIPDLKVYILDRNRQPAPVGVPGELYVGGAGVARGYLNRPELTAAKFMDSPFAARPGERLYRSGDLARFLPNRDIEYLGRIDDQVKIRGFRIELGEIESVLAGLPGVREAVVLAREDVPGDKRLAAYLTVKDGESLKIAELRGLLKAKLPDYMVPPAFVTLDKFPLTANGKVDRKALPRPEVQAPSGSFTPPATETEKTLAAIWCEVLGVKQVGTRDNFFDLGGHSLLAVRLQARVEKELGRRLPLAAFFQAPTISELAALVADPGAVSHGLLMSPRGSSEQRPLLFYLHFLSQAQKLAKHLGPKWPVYAISAPLEDELRLWHQEHRVALSMEELAARCLPIIQRVQPKGPYRLGGGCFGGVLAFEIACQLQRVGEEVVFLALVDAFYGPGCKPLAWPALRRWAYHGARTMSEGLSYPLGKLRARLHVARRRRCQLEKLRAGDGHGNGQETESIRLPQAAFMEQMQRPYRANFFSGNALLIRNIGDPSFTFDPGQANGWEGVIQGNLQIEKLNCGHMDISDEPHIAKVAEWLEEQLSATEARLSKPAPEPAQGAVAAVREIIGSSGRTQPEGAWEQELLKTVGPPSARAVIGPRDRSRACPLSPAQERLWFMEQLHPGVPVYNESEAVRLEGKLDVEAMDRALNELVRRHEILRTKVQVINEQPVAVVLESWRLKLKRIDLEAMEPAKRQAEVERLLTAEPRVAFHLETEPGIRATLVRLGAREHVFILMMHHLICDWSSEGVIWREFSALYRAFIHGQRPELPPLPIQHGDYAAWQKQQMAQGHLAQDLAFWEQNLRGAPALLELPADRPRLSVNTYAGARRRFLLPPTLVQALRECSRGEKTSLFTLFTAALNTLLYRYTGQEDMLLGIALADRDRPELQSLIGFLLRTHVLRTELAGDLSFRDLLARVQKGVLDLYAHRSPAFDQVVSQAHLEHSLSYSSLFQVMIHWRDGDQQLSCLGMEGLDVQSLLAETRTSKLDLTLMLTDDLDNIWLEIEYSTDLFDESRIKRMAGHYQTLLEAVASDAGRRLSELPLLTEAERRQILVDWNPTSKPPLRGGCAHELVAVQAQRSPDAEAVVFKDKRLTYRELDERSNQLAHCLQEMGVGPDVPVGICLQRSLDMVVSVLGVLKAGGAYMPLDSEYPKERLAFMLGDARAPVLLTQMSLRDAIPAGNARVLCLDGDRGLLEAESVEAPVNTAGPDNLAYILYTSGSTGQPKGVAMVHRALVNLLSWQCASPSFSGGRRALQFASLGFDVSFQEMFSTWCSGGALVVVPEELRRDFDSLLPFLQEQKIERLFLPFVALEHLAEIAVQRRLFPSCLREIITAGEQLQCTPDIRMFFQEMPHCTLENQYGPTEAHVVSAYTMTGPPAQWPKLPSIGKPIWNTRLLALGRENQLMPIGVAGELHIGGECLARGYLNRPELTAQKFVTASVDSEPPARFYKTGDLARYLPDGNLQFLGRTDFQVKIRGFRVELGEIEAALRLHPAVQQAVVVACEDLPGGKRLAGYVTLRKDDTTPSDLRKFLGQRLPDYMVPAVVVVLESLPLSPNGKVDRKALPRPDSQPQSTGFVAPASQTEQTLANIWREVLGLQHVSMRDNFFDLGGHSLIAVKLQTRIEKEFGRRLPLAAFFQAPTVSELAALLADPGSLSHGLLMSPQGLSASRPPLFYIHFLTQAQRLAKHLGPKWPVYAISAPLDQELRLWHEQRKLVLTMEELAARCLPIIQRVQSKGPYRLAGGCFGGVLAFEIACQFKRLGEEVSFLALVDAFYGPGCKRLLLPEVRRWVYHGGRTLSEGFNYPLKKFRARRELAEKRRSQVEKMRAGGQPQREDTESIRLPQAAFMEELQKPYMAKPYFGDALLIRSGGDPMFEFDPGPTSGWEGVIQGKLEIEELHCGHMDISEEPHIARVAQWLEKHLDATEASP